MRAVQLSVEVPGVTAGIRPAEASAGFEAFFEAEHARLYRALCLVTRNRHEAEDLMQDAFVRVWERWDRVKAMDDPVGYLYRIAMNGFRTAHRRAALAVKRAIRLTPADDRIGDVDSRDAAVRALAP
jgi:RNA polymerase sigma-70 factor (ECF subfamily)